MKSKIFILPIVFVFLIFSLIYIFASSMDYKVRVTRKFNNFYKIDQTNIWIKTRYCYEPAYYQEIILRIRNYGFVKGKLIFRNIVEYDIVEFYKEVPVDFQTLGVSVYGNVDELECLLVPTTLY